MCEIAVGTATMLECERCDGVWVEASAFERICADRDAQAAVLHRTCGAAPVETDRVRYRPCVRCGKLMNRVNFGKLSGTIVDVCSGHGTFLDAGELHRIVTFIQEGGLDRARERQVEDLHEAERRLREAELMAGRRQSGTLDPTSDRNGVNELLRMLLGIEPEQR
jgi:Zn-finger nucleic acid-binding protein